ncbi:hypothetical protein [Opitutus sp. GAS368]|jgi:hypothetical protein|uniref:hypothetical protein n=1 Tax=Opitutus sp. GAS368 TaxID=1882749 RepID=UPI00087A2EFD|nr:hypothetical protein [Opitutus sp. GAS368]SDR76501.1 hypothetical protein SAMN05444173_0788 [Opitutus sp. GAS368]
MKTYVAVTGLLFVLLVVAHVLRIFSEGIHVAGNPWFLFTTVLSVGLCGWSWRMWRQLSRK